MLVRVREYIDKNGRSPYASWFERLDGRTAAKVATAIVRLEQGNFSNVTGVGSGIFEYRINFGPGYRIYFVKDTNTALLLLGGTKKRQQNDIVRAQKIWEQYKDRKKEKLKKKERKT